ncbi:hypothetical protein HPULCUR_004295 [Helicostylum pulchrum]|uniref:Uncharacterized protein n=1 Tax=Helicostylum pulchrum TaxID=562976 RepID=A0ABP9XWT9_9FUNG
MPIIRNLAVSQIDSLDNVDIYWKEAEDIPIPVSKTRILGDPISYKTYPHSEPVHGKIEADTERCSKLTGDNLASAQPDHKRRRLELETYPQFIEFINQAFKEQKSEYPHFYEALSTNRNIYGITAKFAPTLAKISFRELEIWAEKEYYGKYK